MARRTVVELIDDIDGKPAQETVTFSLDGTAYEIDLSLENAGRLRSGLAPYVNGARKAGTPRGERPVRDVPARPARTGHGREESAEFRAWARQNGIAVNERGRIPAKVIEAYRSGDVAIAQAAAPEPSGPQEPVDVAPARTPVRPVPQATFQAVSNP
jgi:hypothetical protein